ncbi:MAG: hypothetical protein RML72_08070, partial [Bacteroidia bacterium]|nr:hypothetical protein [Bacteroidia bacterium]
MLELVQKNRDRSTSPSFLRKLLLLLVGVLNIFFSVEAQHSYLSKVFKEQEAPVLVVHWNKELPGERIRVQL